MKNYSTYQQWESTHTGWLRTLMALVIPYYNVQRWLSQCLVIAGIPKVVNSIVHRTGTFTSAHKCVHITPLLCQLHWLPVQRWVEFKIACLVHQSLASLAPTNLTTDIHLVSEYGRRPLRSSTDRTLTVPRTHNRFGDRSFAVAGPRL